MLVFQRRRQYLGTSGALAYGEYMFMCSSLLRFVVPICIFASVLMADDPFIGKWKLDPAKSKLTGQTIEIQAVEGNSYSFKEDEHTDIILADGLDHATHFGDTMAIIQKKPDLWAIAWKREGRAVLETVWKVSRDGKTLTYTATGTRPNGQRFSNQMVAKRRGTGSGLSGTWETTGVKLSSPREIYIEAYGTGGHVIVFPGRKQTVRMNFDGKEYPDEGPTTVDGSTSAGLRIDERTIEITERIKGRVIEVGKATISADGKTQTIVVTEPADPTPVVLVYEREP